MEALALMEFSLWAYDIVKQKIPPIALELLLCVRPMGADSAMLPTIKKDINMNINHHNKYYE
jgi:hypothetical protein